MEEGAPHGSRELHNIVLQRFKFIWTRGISASLDIIMCHLFHEVSRAQKWSRMWRSTWFCEVELCHVARKGCCFGVLTVLTVFADELLVFEWTAFKTQLQGYSYRNTGSSQRFCRRTRALRLRLLRMANRRSLELVVWSDNSWNLDLVCLRPRGLCSYSPESRGGSRTYADAACSLQTLGG